MFSASSHIRASRLLLRIALTGLTVTANALTLANPSGSPVDIYAAGSLREAMTALEAAYRTDESKLAGQTTFAAKFLFGPSGKLRERIEAGERPALFASASPAHTEKLLATGLLRSSNLFAGNALCVMARPGFALTGRSVPELFLDDGVSLGTSTPGADPSGDYTWQMFRKIDAAQPGAFAKLDAKAKKLTGAEVNPNETQSAYVRVLREKQADVFVSYCTNARSAQKVESAIRFIEVPREFNVTANYSIGIAPNASDGAREFLRFVLSERARPVLAALGFSAPEGKCENVPSAVKSAHDAWLAARLKVSASTTKFPEIKMATRYTVTLLPGSTFSLARMPKASNGARAQNAGVVRMSGGEGGHIEVFTDRRAWFDVIRERDGRVLDSVRSERWLGCAGVGKNLGFALDANERYRIEFSEIDGSAIDVLLMKLDPR